MIIQKTKLWSWIPSTYALSVIACFYNPHLQIIVPRLNNSLISMAVSKLIMSWTSISISYSFYKTCHIMSILNGRRFSGKCGQRCKSSNVKNVIRGSMGITSKAAPIIPAIYNTQMLLINWKKMTRRDRKSMKIMAHTLAVVYKFRGFPYLLEKRRRVVV